MTGDSTSTSAARPSARAKARLAWLRLHRWAGLALLAAFLAMGLTGTALVWRDAGERIVHPDRFPAVTTTDASASPATLLAAGQAALPAGIRATDIQLAASGDAVIVTGESHGPAILGIGPQRRSRVWLDPADATILTTSTGSPDFIFVAKAVHGHLLIAGGGRWVVAGVGLFLLFSAASGLWLWWPGRRKIIAALKWRKGLSRSMNLHRQLGPLAAIGFIAQGATGILMALPWVLSMFAAPPAIVPQGPPTLPSRPLETTRLPADTAIVAGRSIAAKGEVIEIQLPTQNAPHWTLAFDNGDVVTVDDRTGAPKIEPPHIPSASERAEDFVSTVHGGGYGAVHRLLLSLTGVALILLSITGLLLWMQGKRRKRR